jgi:hypothetical protein
MKAWVNSRTYRVSFFKGQRSQTVPTRKAGAGGLRNGVRHSGHDCDEDGRKDLHKH